MRKLELVAAFVGLTAFANAQDLKKNEFSISLGYMFEGEAYAWEFDQYASVGETILIKAEFNHFFSSLSDRFGIGAYYNFASPYYGGYETVTQHEFGLVLKMRFSANEKLQIKPGVYTGFRSYSDDAGTGLGVNASVAFQYLVNEKLKPFLELGILTQPAGGNDDTDITYSPTFQVSVGVTF